ncbi:hypothetical protein BR93DRAFT_967454 [Coniochaeta sp. PMI_546]|nr:hypothetical protein BR93DRAFT_967454 [Coniochaeta sp. PMI_546]
MTAISVAYTYTYASTTYPVVTAHQLRLFVGLSSILSRDEFKADELRDMAKTAVGAIYRLGVAPSDANLVNCHVVAGDRIMIVDHEQDEEVDADYLKGHAVEEFIEAKVDSIMERYWDATEPTVELDPEAERRAHKE